MCVCVCGVCVCVRACVRVCRLTIAILVVAGELTCSCV